MESQITSLATFRYQKHRSELNQKQQLHTQKLAEGLEELNRNVEIPRGAFTAFATGIRHYQEVADKELAKNPEAHYANALFGIIKEATDDPHELTLRFYNGYVAGPDLTVEGLPQILFCAFTSTFDDTVILHPALANEDMCVRLDESYQAYRGDRKGVSFYLTLFVGVMVELESLGFRAHVYDHQDNRASITYVKDNERVVIEIYFDQLLATYDEALKALNQALQDITHEKAKELGVEDEWLDVHQHDH